MAVTPIAYKLNQDNENWNDGHLLDELEKLFSQLGWHSGTIRYGVPTYVAPAGYSNYAASSTLNVQGRWDTSGGTATAMNQNFGAGGVVSALSSTKFRTRRFDVTKDGTSNWQLQEYWKPTSVDASTNTITFPATTQYYTPDGTKVETFAQTGKKIVWMPEDSAGSNNIGGLTPGNTYYVIAVSADDDKTEIKLADTYSEAIAGTPVKNLSGDPTSGTYLYDTTNKQIFREAIGTDNNNGSVNNKDREVVILQGDYLEYHFPNNDIAEFKIVNQSLANGDSYSTTKELSFANRDNLNVYARPNSYYGQSNNYYPTSTSGEHTTGNFLKWWSTGWGCSEDQMPDYWIDEPGNGTIPALDSITPGNRAISNNYAISPKDGSGDGTWPNSQWYPRNEYWYVSAANPSDMQGKISIRGRCHSHNSSYQEHNPFWYVTIPGSTGGGTTTGAADLKLRIERGSYGYNSSWRNRIRNIEILNVASTSTSEYNSGTGQNGGWADSKVFTIDGVLSGGVTSTNDISFGANAAESSNYACDGTCSLHTTDYKGVGGWWQRDKNDKFAVLRVENSSGKKYGVTFYAFYFDYRSSGNTDTTNSHRLSISSGIYWNTMNQMGVNDSRKVYHSYSRSLGTWAGKPGIECQTSNYLNCDLDQAVEDGVKILNFTSDANPYTYKHEVRLYQAPNTQDSNFAIISFVGYQSNTPILYDSFILHKGTTFGNPNPGVDLDHLHMAGVTKIVDYQSSNNFHTNINIETYMPALYASYSGSTYYGCATVPASTTNGLTLTRNYLYGYMRDAHQRRRTFSDNYGQNIFDTTSGNDPGNAYGYYQWNMFYHRDVTYERISETESNQIDFYKPISGIPICSKFIPCPYYMPDDFVFIQASSTPNAIDYRVGDTVTVSGNEKYSVVVPSTTGNVNGLGDPNDSSSTHTASLMLCVRIAN